MGKKLKRKTEKKQQPGLNANGPPSHFCVQPGFYPVQGSHGEQAYEGALPSTEQGWQVLLVPFIVPTHLEETRITTPHVLKIILLVSSVSKNQTDNNLLADSYQYCIQKRGTQQGQRAWLRQVLHWLDIRDIHSLKDLWIMAKAIYAIIQFLIELKTKWREWF